VVNDDYTPFTEWSKGLAIYDERRLLANSDPTHVYLVEERPGPVIPMREYRIVRKPKTP